jgi:hypothetical protein
MSELHRMLVGFAGAGVFVAAIFAAIGIAAGSSLLAVWVVAGMLLAASIACGVGAYWEMRGKPNAPRSVREWFSQYFTITVQGLRLAFYSTCIMWVMVVIRTPTVAKNDGLLRFHLFVVAGLGLATALSFYRYRTRILKRWLGWPIMGVYFGALVVFAALAVVTPLPRLG